ncbi:hypothetical protein KI387_013637, partial [Taxus chinensis]
VYTFPISLIKDENPCLKSLKGRKPLMVELAFGTNTLEEGYLVDFLACFHLLENSKDKNDDSSEVVRMRVRMHVVRQEMLAAAQDFSGRDITMVSKPTILPPEGYACKKITTSTFAIKKR